MRVELRTRQYLVDEKGRRTGVVLSVKEYEALLEDLQDLRIIAERKDEPSQPLDVVTGKLERRWRRTASK